MDTLDSLGIVEILEKNEINIEGKIIVYYKVISCSYGFYHTFDDGIIRFVCLSGEFCGQKIVSCKNSSKYFVNNRYLIMGFKTIRQFLKENNGNMDLDLFIKEAHRDIGEYYFLAIPYFSTIENKRILNAIKESEEDNVIDIRRYLKK